MRKAAWKIIVDMTHATDPCTARAAWEALLVAPRGINFNVDWKTGLQSKDRRGRAAVSACAKGAGNASFRKSPIDDSVHFDLAVCWLLDPRSDADKRWSNVLEDCADRVRQERDPAMRMEAVRLMQLALGDVVIDEGPGKAFWGYRARNATKHVRLLLEQIAIELAKVFPTDNVQLDMELARLLGMLGADAPGVLSKVANQWTRDNSIESDIHYLLAFSQIPGKRDMGVTQQTAAALNGIILKFAAQGARPSDQVPDILEGLLERLAQLDPNLPQALVDDKTFGNPGHALYANKLPLPQKQTAARKIIAQIGKLNAEDAQLAWNPELVRLAGSLPDDEAASHSAGAVCRSAPDRYGAAAAGSETQAGRSALRRSVGVASARRYRCRRGSVAGSIQETSRRRRRLVAPSEPCAASTARKAM